MRDKKHKPVANKNKKSLSDEHIAKIESKFDTGKGVAITIESSNPKTGKNDVTYHYTNKLDKINTKMTDLTVAVSSIEADNEELLHFLLKKSRE
jgi:glutamate 5-kinase